MKQRCLWSSMQLFRLVVSVKWIKLLRRETSRMVGVWVNCTWRQLLSAHIWTNRSLSFTCTRGNFFLYVTCKLAPWLYEVMKHFFHAELWLRKQFFTVFTCNIAYISAALITQLLFLFLFKLIPTKIYLILEWVVN